MAIHATHVLPLVRSTLPEAVLLFGVTILADLVFALLGPRRVGSEGRHGRALLAEADPAGVIAAGAVTGLALIAAKRRTFVSHDAMRPLEDCIEVGAVLIAMATQAPIGTAPRVLWHVVVSLCTFLVLRAGNRLKRNKRDECSQNQSPAWRAIKKSWRNVQCLSPGFQ